MDIAEILMAEHSSIRVWSLRRDGAEEWFPGLNSFVVEMHAGDLEDDLLFPALRKAKANDEDFLFNLTRIANADPLPALKGEGSPGGSRGGVSSVTPPWRALLRRGPRGRRAAS